MKNRLTSILKSSYDTFFLVAVVLICCGALYFVNGLTASKRLENESLEQNLALAKLYSGPNLNFTPVKNNRYVSSYAYLNEGKELILTLSGSGYGGTISMLAHYASSGEVINIVCVDHSETDGIGSIITLKNYMDIFKGYGFNKKIPTTKREVDSKYIDTISGATVSFNGVSGAVVAGSSFVKELANKEVDNG